MPHLDPDDLALLALGENLGAAVDAHVTGCAACSGEIESFRMTVGLAELSNYGEDAPQPGEHVWQAIAAELGFSGARAGTGGLATVVGELDDQPPAAVPTPTTPPAAPAATTTPAAATAEPPSAGQPPHPAGLNGSAGPVVRSVPGTGPAAAGSRAPRARRWSRWVAPLAAAVVGIAVGAGAVVISQSQTDKVTIEAIAPLTAVPGGPLTADEQRQLGRAELVAAAAGQEVRVDATDLPPPTNSYEVWLFGGEGRMVSLGTLNDRWGSFTVPQGINPAEYSVVDISDEAPDGNPAHSGVSLVRGAFS